MLKISLDYVAPEATALGVTRYTETWSCPREENGIGLKKGGEKKLRILNVEFEILINKLTTVGLVSLLFGTVTVAPAFAQTVSPSASSTRKDANLSRMHTACDNAISQRLTSLNTALSKIGVIKRLSDSQKQQYTNEVNTDIQALNTLKTKCDGDTDMTTLRADYRSVFTAYRVYAEFLPQVHVLATVDAQTTTANNLTVYEQELSTRVQNAGNPSNLTSLLSDIQSKIAAAQTQMTNAQNAVFSLTPNSYNTDPTGTKTAFQTARADLKTSMSDLQAAFTDGKSIRKGLPKPSTTNASSSAVTQ